MVKVYGPMMSMGASGTLAKTITFSTWKGRPYVRERVIPANPKSVGQVGRRIMFAFLAQQWASLPNAEQMAFKDQAESLNVSKFNAYVQFNMRRWNDFDGVSQQYPATETGTIGVAGTPSCTWEGNQIHYQSVDFAFNDNWGIVLHGHKDTGFDAGINNSRAVVQHNTAAPVHIYWTPEKVETLYCRISCFTTDGVMGPAEAQIEVAP